MDPFRGSSSWWAANSPNNPYLNYHQAPYSAQSWQWVEGYVRHHQQMVQHPGNSLYPIPVQVQMPYTHASQHQDGFQPAQVRQVQTGQFQVQQAAQQNPASTPFLRHRQFSIDTDTPGGSSSWRAADPPSYPDQHASQSSQPWQRVENGVQHHQQTVQNPAYSIWSMPDDVMKQLIKEILDDVETENRSCPPINGNNLDKVPSPDGGYCSDSGYHTTYQQPLQPFPAPYGNVDSRPETRMIDANVLGVTQENPGVYRSIYPQPIDINGQQRPAENRSIFYESTQQLESNKQPQIPSNDLPNPSNSQVLEQIQYDQTNKALEDKTLVRKAGRYSLDKARIKRSKAVKSSAHKCPKCHLLFRSQGGLTQHQSWIHSDRDFQCMQCSKKFPSQIALDKHIAAHNMSHKPFKCSECPKEFCHQGELRRHKYRHADSTPYVCNVCSRRFTRNDHLSLHLLRHEQSEYKIRNETRKDS